MMTPKNVLPRKRIAEFIDHLYEGDLHAKRATPLMWRTVESSSLKGQMKRHETQLLERLREVVPAGVKVTVVADRGVGDCKLFKTLAEGLGFGYVIRIRGDIYVTSAKGERRKAAQWVGVGGRSRTLRGARVSAECSACARANS